MAELGLAILVFGVLLLTDKARLEWLLDKVQMIFRWLASE